MFWLINIIVLRPNQECFTHVLGSLLPVNFCTIKELARHLQTLFVCLCVFVCLGFFAPLDNFSLICRRHHCRLRAANFDRCSALMAIEQWGFISVPYLLWHGASVYNGHLRGPVKRTPIYCRAFTNGTVTTCFFTTQVCRGWDTDFLTSGPFVVSSECLP